MKNAMASLKNVLMRIIAVFAASGLGVIGAGAVAGAAAPVGASLAILGGLRMLGNE